MADSASEKVCPNCGASLQNTVAEKSFKPLGAGRKFKMDPVTRDNFVCGAVVLNNKQYPEGIMEASCCMKDENAPVSSQVSA